MEELAAALAGQTMEKEVVDFLDAGQRLVVLCLFIVILEALLDGRRTFLVIQVIPVEVIRGMIAHELVADLLKEVEAGLNVADDLRNLAAELGLHRRQLLLVGRDAEAVRGEELRRAQDRRDAALGEGLAGLDRAVSADSEVGALEGRPEQLLKLVHELPGERRLSVLHGHAGETERLAERLQERRTRGVVVILRPGRAEHLSDEIPQFAVLLDAALAIQVGDGVCTAEIDVAEGPHCRRIEIDAHFLVPFYFVVCSFAVSL